MTINDYKQLVTASPNREILMNYEFDWNFKRLCGHRSIKSVTSLYEYAIYQWEEWERTQVNSQINNNSYYKNLIDNLSQKGRNYFGEMRDAEELRNYVFNEIQRALNNIAEHCSDI